MKKGRYAKVQGDHWRTRALQVSLAAEGLNTRGESYCADVQSDGQVPMAFVASLCGGRVAGKVIDELIAAGWWEAHGNGFRIVGYLDRNISKADDAKRRDGIAKRTNKSRSKSRDTPPPDNDGGNEPRNGAGNALHNSPSLTPSVEEGHQDPDLASLARGPEARERGTHATPAGVIEAAYASALGAAKGRYVPHPSRDLPHWRAALDAVRAMADGEPLNVAALRLARAYVAARRSRSPEWFAEWLQRRAASGDQRTTGGRVEPLPNSEYQGTSEAEIEAMFGPVTDEDLARVDGRRRAHG